MIKKVVLALFGLVALGIACVLILAASRPNQYRVERRATLGASPAVVYALVNDFHHWPEWSPWEKLDPAMRRTYDGPPSGVGSSYAWSGNDKVGEGKMTITESEPDARVVLRLEFIKPWASINRTEFTIEPSEGGSRITWTMDGNNNLMSKIVGLFMNMDELIGKDFESGLANLQALAESVPAAVPDSAATAPD